ncbi:MAG TPA: cytochrome c [Polyangia bacterium]|jgi:Cytochrome c.|nr:cytochrome c [Polyangia bacterium]
MSRRSSLFPLLLVPPLVALLASPILRHAAQAETAGTPLAQPAGYKPEKKVIRQWDSKCATCHGEDGRGHTEQGKEMGIDDMTKAAYWKDVTVERARKFVLEGLKRTVNGKDQEMKPFGDRLTPQQVDALNLYAVSFFKK